MKVRNGFVSNSSSSSFIITNKSSKKLTLVDFVKENPQLVKEWNEQYNYKETQKNLIESAKSRNLTFDANSSREYIFGDEEGTLIGRVFDYILRVGGSSKNFEWEYYNSYR